MPINRIIPELRSQDLPATEDLYCNVLGLQMDMSDEQSGFRSFCSPDNPSAQVIVNDNGHVGLPRGFAIDVGDPQQVDAIHQAIGARGLAVVEPLTTKPWGIRRFSFVDHNGERITVIAHAAT
jgi:catechol 2,3-dioxygenase-like lactoylglutathione lyase family enzyme